VSVVAESVPLRGSIGLRRDLVVGTAATLAIVATFFLAPISGASLGAARLESAGRVLVAGIPMAVGLYAWRGGPFVRLGRLLVAASVIWLVVTSSLDDEAVANSTGRVAGWVAWAALLYLVLAFPDGRLYARVDRVLAGGAGLLLAVLWLPTALLVERYPTPSEWVTCGADCPHNAFMVVAHQPGLIAQVVVPMREVLTVLLFLAVVARLAGRVASASRVRRRPLTPVLAVAATGIALTAFALAVRSSVPGSPPLSVSRWVAAFALPAMALAFLAGLLSWRLYVGASLARFTASLSSPPRAGGVRAALAEAFEDPSLDIAYPVAVARWATADGYPRDAPVAVRGCSVTEVRKGGRLSPL
jgi:hypothetical protein